MKASPRSRPTMGAEYGFRKAKADYQSFLQAL